MTKASFSAYPYLLGFDRIDRLAERAAAAADGYPPCNIEQCGPDSFRITLAVAGFTQDALSISVEDRQLVVRGRNTANGSDEHEFLHRGIASRAFQRSFVLAEGMEVTGADLANGLLSIDLRRQVPERSAQTIPISRK